MTDERKPLAPDRPGRYLLENQQTIELFAKYGGMYFGVTTHHGRQYSCSVTGEGEHPELGENIIARAPDDAAWCLAQARLLCPEGYAVAPEDLLTHMNDWKVACTRSLQVSVADEDKSYWQHQLDVLSKIEGVIASASERK